MRKNWLMAIVAASVGVAGLGLFAVATAAPDQAILRAAVGRPAPDFALGDVYGKSFKLSEFKDHVVVLEWLNKGCPVSRRCHDQAIMQGVYKKYAAKGVIWLAIDTTRGLQPAANRVYAAEQGMAYPILHDLDGSVGKLYGAKTTPHMYVIDKKGVLVYAGAIDDDPPGRNKDRTNYVAAALDAVLAGNPVAKPKTDSYGCGVKYPPAKKKAAR